MERINFLLMSGILLTLYVWLLLGYTFYSVVYSYQSYDLACNILPKNAVNGTWSPDYLQSLGIEGLYDSNSDNITVLVNNSHKTLDRVYYHEKCHQMQYSIMNTVGLQDKPCDIDFTLRKEFQCYFLTNWMEYI